MEVFLRQIVGKRRLPLRCHNKPWTTTTATTAVHGRTFSVPSSSASTQQQQQQPELHNHNSSFTVSRAPVARQSRDGYNELVQYTDQVLNSQRTRLGTLSENDWKNILSSMHVWLGKSKSQTLEQQLSSLELFPRDTGPPLVVPRHVFAHYRLLERLLYEQSCQSLSNNTRLFLERQATLQALVAISFRAWIQVAHQFPDAPLPIEKTLKLWRVLLQNNSNNTPLPELAALLAIEQNFVQATVDTNYNVSKKTCLEMIHRMLSHIHASEDSAALAQLDEQTRDILKYCHQRAVALALQLRDASKQQRRSTGIMFRGSTTKVDDITGAAAEVLKRMEELSALPGWQDVRVQGGELNHILDVLFLENDGTDSSVTPKRMALSKYEQAALQQRVLEHIQKADVDDRKAVEDVIDRWRLLQEMQEKHSDTWEPFAQAVVDYYLRIEDPKSSTKWMQILELVPSKGVTEATETGEISSEKTAVEPMGASETTQQLKAVDQAYKNNRDGRIQRKLDLLKIMVVQGDSREAPYRATEVLESLEREGAFLSLDIYLSVVKLWIDRSKDDVSSLQRAISIAMRSPDMDNEEVLALVSKLVQRVNEQKHGASLESALKLLDILSVKFESENPSNRSLSILDDIAAAAAGSQRLNDVVTLLLEKGISVSPRVLEYVLDNPYGTKFSFQEVCTRLEFLEYLVESGVGASLECYKLALRLLLVHCTEPQVDYARIFLTEALDSTARKEASDLSPFKTMVNTVLNHVHDAKTTLAIIQGAEEKLVQPGKVHFASPAAFQYYRRYFQMYHEDLEFVEELFKLLKAHQQSGFDNLYPDNVMYSMYMNTLAFSKGLDSLEKRIELLDDLIQQYESKPEQENLRPNFEMFENVISGLHSRCKEIDSAVASSSGIDPYEQDSRKMVALLEKMHQLRIVPTDVSRSNVFGYAMGTVLKCQNKVMHFKVVMDLKQQMSDLQVKPDFFTVLYQLQACKLAALGSTKRSLWGMRVMLEALTEARSLGKATDRLYFTCFEVILANYGTVLPTKKDEADTILSALFECCCADGALSHFAKDIFLRFADPTTVERLYIQRLLKDKKPPAHWTRNVTSRTSPSKQQS